ncbi:MAG: hypothetical protein QM638_05105 [Nocardioides sp.]|uniref:hypothetical protein n=1 Tax=Nocardioides sp. TaxID=35761 RepID=UPI0039E31011
MTDRTNAFDARPIHRQRSHRPIRRRTAITSAAALFAAAATGLIASESTSPATGATAGIKYRRASHGANNIDLSTTSSQTGTASDGAYGGTSGWALSKTVDLTEQPSGTTYTTGVRTNTDQSYNRKAQATWGSDGLTVTAERSGGTIYSADVMLRGVNIPSVAAIEMDIDMQGTGAGLGHAVWFRPLTGSSGEMDLLEYVGSNAGKGISGGAGTYEAKSTLIRTGSSPYNQGSKAFGIAPRSNGSYDGIRRYRYEFTSSSVSLWVDGSLAGSITKAQFEKQNSSGSWSQFTAGTHWYPRVTLQVNNGTSAKLWGTVPDSWKSSSINVSAMRIYTKA